MTIGGVLGALRRRWLVVIVGLLVTAGLAWGATKISPPEFTARALVLLLPPSDDEADGGNPFLNLGNLDLPARVLVASFSSNAAQEDIAARAPDAEVVVSIEESTRGPVIAVDVKDSSADGALETLNYVAGTIPTTLASLQSEVGVPGNAVVRSMPLTTDAEAEEDYGNFIRVLIAAVAGGLALTVVLTYAIDSLLLRGSRGSGRRRTASEPFASDGPLPLPESDSRPAQPLQPIPAKPRRRSSRDADIPANR